MRRVVRMAYGRRVAVCPRQQNARKERKKPRLAMRSVVLIVGYDAGRMVVCYFVTVLLDVTLFR